MSPLTLVLIQLVIFFISMNPIRPEESYGFSSPSKYNPSISIMFSGCKEE